MSTSLRTASQQEAHENVVAYNLREISTHPKGREILAALVTIADAGPFGMWRADAIAELLRCILERETADIAKIRATLARLHS